MMDLASLLTSIASIYFLEFNCLLLCCLHWDYQVEDMAEEAGAPRDEDGGDMITDSVQVRAPYLVHTQIGLCTRLAL